MRVMIQLTSENLSQINEKLEQGFYIERDYSNGTQTFLSLYRYEAPEHIGGVIQSEQPEVTITRNYRYTSSRG